MASSSHSFHSIKYLLNCKAYDVLVVPNWPSAVFWPMLFDENLYYKTYVKDVLFFKDTKEIIIQGQNKSCSFGSIFFGSGILVVRLDATNVMNEGVLQMTWVLVHLINNNGTCLYVANTNG